MTGIDMLWLPILLSSVFVFIASSIIHMAPLWHKNDYPRYKDEDKVRDALRPLQLPPGEYMMPRATSSQEMRSAEFKEKLNQGPVLMLKVFPAGQFRMGKPMVLWFLYTIVIGIFAAYVAGRALPPGAEYLHVFRFAGVASFLGYAGAVWQDAIWFRKPLVRTVLATWDGLIYAMLTGGTFGWLWPRIFSI